MRTIIIITCFLFSFGINAQKSKRKLRPILWTIHSKNTDIIGASIGILPKEVFRDSTLTRTFGVRIEAPGLGLLLPLAPRSPISTSEKSYQASLHQEPIEVVYGINLSSGSLANTQINGISGALIGQYLIKMNGISFATLGNLIERNNGISVAIVGNETYKTNGISASISGNSTVKLNGMQIGGYNETKHLNGVQIGIFNTSKKSKGIQIGLWNKNEKRTLPFINWNFKS
ncbi:hypothetical protein [uncultured Tenacibaculum sp.]|uniref:LA_2272 family surface repeat-containing protein n=1 Tax=uncultured Tenacibaculum sp. TaxID=174713 RepID=UPI002628BF8C|nr:hypothetical protein [uncultured Tenacibaculum sp.]